MSLPTISRQIRRLGSGCCLSPLLLFLLALAAAAAEPAPPRLGLPIACAPGADCWIANHVDLDPGPGVRDYRCGQLTYDGHRGVDIAVADLAAMNRGVAVLAAAPGVVAGLRDGEPDLSIRQRGGAAVQDRECGNGVVLRHPGGWETQYCHMRRDSIAVRRGQTVAAGDRLGLVGLSGQTEYPHLHFSLRHDGKVVDPFLGAAGAACAADGSGLWRPEVAATLPYAPGVIANAGLAGRPVDAEEVRRGLTDPGWSGEAKAAVLWAELYGVAPGDRLEMRILGPDGREIAARSETLERRQARIFRVFGRKVQALAPGTYRGEIRLVHAAPGLDDHRRAVIAEVR